MANISRRTKSASSQGERKAQHCLAFIDTLADLIATADNTPLQTAPLCKAFIDAVSV